MYGKPVTDKVKQIIALTYNQPIYLYDAKTLTLIKHYENPKSFVKDLKISTKTVIKYRDSNKVYRDLYIISSVELTVS